MVAGREEAAAAHTALQSRATSGRRLFTIS
jgi:hypothetical protein